MLGKNEKHRLSLPLALRSDAAVSHPHRPFLRRFRHHLTSHRDDLPCAVVRGIHGNVHLYMSVCHLACARRAMGDGGCLTSNLLRLEGIRLDLLLGQYSQHNHTVRSFLKPLLSGLQSFRVNQPSIDLGPSCPGRNPLLMRIFQRRHTLAYRVWLFRELLARLFQDAFQLSLLRSTTLSG